MKLKKENQLSFLFICHDLALVQMFCDRVIVMHDGHVEEEGTPEEIIEHPKTEYTKRLIRVGAVMPTDKDERTKPSVVRILRAFLYVTR